VVVACWSPKGGSGTTVVAVALARMLAGPNGAGALLVDLGGDAASALGSPEPTGPGVAEWLEVGHDVPADGLARIEHELLPGLALITRGAGPFTNVVRAEVLAAVLAADRRAVVVDCGRVGGPESGAEGEVGRVLASSATHSLLVVRPCYLALRRATAMSFRPSGVVVVNERGRALEPGDIEDILGVAVVAVVEHDLSVGRAVDAGLLGARLPTTLRRALRRAA
jgi:MinD-like ATPase involved in chromosome partitioning or flagellar assembly